MVNFLLIKFLVRGSKLIQHNWFFNKILLSFCPEYSVNFYEFKNLKFIELWRIYLRIIRTPKLYSPKKKRLKRVLYPKARELISRLIFFDFGLFCKKNFLTLTIRNFKLLSFVYLLRSSCDFEKLIWSWFAYMFHKYLANFGDTSVLLELFLVEVF